MFSTLPWPKGWCRSAGLPEVLTANRAIIAANKSMPEWMASEITDTDPMARPTANFRSMRVVLETTEILATEAFRLSTISWAPCMISDAFHYCSCHGHQY